MRRLAPVRVAISKLCDTSMFFLLPTERGEPHRYAKSTSGSSSARPVWLPIFVASVALRKADRVGLLSSICCSIPSMQPWARNSKVAHRADNMINIRYIFFLINGLMEEAKKVEGKS